jgi:hypothetical protein
MITRRPPRAKFFGKDARSLRAAQESLRREGVARMERSDIRERPPHFAALNAGYDFPLKSLMFSRWVRFVKTG